MLHIGLLTNESAGCFVLERGRTYTQERVIAQLGYQHVYDQLTGNEKRYPCLEGENAIALQRPSLSEGIYQA